MKSPGKSKQTPPPGHALHLRSKAAQLCEYLRAALAEGRIANPPPGIRLWSQQLGVSRRTLHAALNELQSEGLLTVTRTGVRLATESTSRRKTSGPHLVHMLLDAAYRRHLNNYLETLSTLQERLLVHGIELRWEMCTPSRLREIARQRAVANELLILASLSPVYQRLFSESAKPAIVLGEVAAGLSFPFVNANQTGAVRHATFKLLQREFKHVSLVHLNVEAAGIKSALAAFRSACAEWPHQPVTARLIPTALDRRSLATMARRLAEGVKGRQGFIVLAPVPLGIVVTALLQHGVAVPKQADVISLFHTSEAVTLFPPPTHYPSPITAIVKQLVEAALHFFEHGALPNLKKTIPVEVAKSD